MAKFYITTSIAYVNAPPHVGFALELIQADVIARFQRKKGSDVFFLTGTDEHGAKVAKAAQEAGSSPQEFTDRISAQFRNLAKALTISNDYFIRTTDKEHHWPCVKAVWKKLKDRGDFYKKKYEGFYCIGCEAFITKKDLKEGICRIHLKKPEVVREENWFFRLSRYQKDIENVIKKGKIHIVPESGKNEILKFIQKGLQDVSFSRPRKDLQWGIPVPGDDTQTIYVWADALVNYLSALGYPDGEQFKKYWPADVHIIGKDILRFHATLWPAILLSLGIELPKTIFVHGYITSGGQKMSKSLGNVVDPFSLIEKYGADALRYFLLREIPPTQDGDFTKEKFTERYNADLAGGLGNLVARTLKLGEKIAFAIPPTFQNKELQRLVEKTKQQVSKLLEEFQFHLALEKIWSIIKFCDRYIDEKRPWAESEEKQKIIEDLLLALFEIGNILQPFLPDTAEKINHQLQGKTRKILFPRLSS